MAESERVICASRELVDAGRGVRFEVEYFGEPAPAFVVRYRGTAHGYLNRCAHVWVEMDAQPGQFFDFTGLYLVCSTHGAAYIPETGYCIAGPCKGQRLTKLAVEEHDGGVYLLNNEETVHV